MITTYFNNSNVTLSRMSSKINHGKILKIPHRYDGPRTYQYLSNSSANDPIVDLKTNNYCRNHLILDTLLISGFILLLVALFFLLIRKQHWKYHNYEPGVRVTNENSMNVNDEKRNHVVSATFPQIENLNASMYQL